MIAVVLFDLDDTLFAHRRAVEEGVVAHLRAIGELPAGTIDAAEVTRWNELEETYYSRYLTGELEYLGQRRARARDFMRPYGVEFEDDLAAEAWFEDYVVEYRAAWTLHDDTLPVLDALAPLRVGLITNGDLEFQLAKLRAIGLDSKFEHVIASGEFGIAKPDPRIFLHACTLFGVVPTAAVYVGDRLNTDAIGASMAGLTGIWIDRDATATADQLAEAEAAGVRVIHSLAELPPLLAAL